MASVNEIGKPPLGAALAEGVRALSMDQEIAFSLYRRYVFPLDGMNYWIRVLPSNTTVTTAGVQLTPGLTNQTVAAREAIQVAPGNLNLVLGGTIINPLSASDQGLNTAESLFVDFTGPAYSYVTGTTMELKPGRSVNIPANCTTGAWVCATSGQHKFSCVLQQAVTSVTLPTDVTVKGSLHYSSVISQEEDATVDSNTVVFTALSEIQQFNLIGPDYLYIASFDGLSFAFSSRGRLYEQADLYHYQGQALKSRHLTLIIDDPSTFNPTLTVSNSLPLWLNMPNYVPPYPGFTCDIPLYPSYLVDDNLPPPFGAVHIDRTETLEMGSHFGPRLQQSQLCKELVRIHLYGADNLMASNFVAFVEQYSLDWMKLGLTDSPAIKDEKLTQPEFKILAQRKSIEFNINYRQNVIRDEARQLIEHAKVRFYDPHWLNDPTGGN